MKPKIEYIIVDPRTTIHSSSDHHYGNGRRADNAVPSKNGTEAMMVEHRSKWFWIFLGDVWEWWEFSKKETTAAWEKITAFIQSRLRVRGNHDEEDKAPDMIIAEWGEKRIGFVHDPTFKYKGKLKRIAKWLVRNVWRPIEAAVGWRKGLELSSALDDEDYMKYDNAALNMLVTYDLDLLLYGHIHPKEAYLIRSTIGNRAVINTGRFQDGLCEFTALTQNKGRINVAVCRFSGKRLVVKKHYKA